MIKNILFLAVGIFLVIMAVIDQKRKEIPFVPCVVGFLIILVCQMILHTPWGEWLPGVLIGAGLYGISKVTDGAVGEGDACIYVLTGSLLGFMKNVELLVFSLLLCSAVSLVLLVFRRVGRKDKMAFIPFIAMAYGVVMLL